MTSAAAVKTPCFDLTGKRVFLAGHRGMVGSAMARRLAPEHCEVLTTDRRSLDLTRQADTRPVAIRSRLA
jgi:GDP-L-fucose synthase